MCGLPADRQEEVIDMTINHTATNNPHFRPQKRRCDTFFGDFFQNRGFLRFSGRSWGGLHFSEQISGFRGD